ncbi:SPARC-related modular calcium-binding protein 1 isoform X3 [Pseudomyrmex gracilis]|uniref:SPARC-related modular calcium-binding protein 1 isoform X3 n=1 Tax=Pseudomyrmex gracilis TaxID=219809 RepID=UPI000994CCA6|nr:SPARC-related modular calcium-binding protein 1 isoform X3 [Pseudomyrmex gracilis]
MMLIHAATFLLLIVDIHAATSTVTTARETCRTRIAECTMNGGNVPVCGSDGVTYPSQCKVISQQCQGVSVLIKHTGPCAETPPCFSARLTARPGARPLCRRDGTYAPVQCHGETGYCWCVTPQGRALPDTSVRHKRPRCSKSSLRSASTRSGGERRRSHRQYNSNRHRNTCDRTEKSKFNGNLIENFKIEFRRTNMSSADDDKNVELVLSWKFNTLDKDRDGFLNKSEYTELRRLARKAVKPKKCARTFARTCDLNRDLKLSRQEWGACLANDFMLRLFLSLNPADERPEVPEAQRTRAMDQALKGIHVSLQTTPTIQPFNDFLDANSKEESDTNDCLSDRRSALEPLQDQNKTSRSQLYIPECTPDGRYHRIQCYSGYCWCVLQDSGKPIPGTSIKQPISPNCNPVPTPSRPIKGCSESRKQQFLQDLVNLMQTRMTASIDTNETAKWNASPQEKLLEKKEWKGFRTLVSNDKQLRKCGKKLPKHCDVNNDRVISMTEWLNCLHVSYSLTDRDIEKASNLNKAVNQTKRIGPNPLDRYLNGTVIYTADYADFGFERETSKSPTMDRNQMMKTIRNHIKHINKTSCERTKTCFVLF